MDIRATNVSLLTFRFSHFVFLLLFSFVVAALGESVVANDFRLWRDNSGNFSVRAKLIAKSDDTVKLESEAGKTIDVPISRLSRADQQFLKNLPNSSPSASGGTTTGGEKSTSSPQNIQRQIQLALRGNPVQGQAEDNLTDFLARLPFSVYVDRQALNSAGVRSDQPIDSKPVGETLADQLQSVVSQLKLSWQVRQTVVVIGGQAKRRPLMQTVVYEIGRNDPSDLQHQLESIDGASWMSMGGQGRAVPVVSRMVVTQTANTHFLIERELKLRPVATRYPHPLDNILVTISAQQMMLEDFVRNLSQKLPNPIRIDEGALQYIGLTSKLPVTASFENCSAKDVLDLVLLPLDCTWREEPNAIIVTTSGASEKALITEQVRFQIRGLPRNNGSELAQFVRMTVAPDSWAELGGPGIVKPSGDNGLTVSQSAPVLRAIQELVVTLSSAAK